MNAVLMAATPASIGAGGFLGTIAAALVVWMSKSIKNAAPIAFRFVDKDAAAEIAKLRVDVAAGLARERILENANSKLQGDIALLRYRLRDQTRHPEGE